MHTDLFKEKIENDTLYELGWYERSPVVLNGDHDRNEGFESRLDQLRRLAGRAEDRHRHDEARPRRWLHLITGDEPRQAYLTSFFYCDEQIRAGEMRLPAAARYAARVDPVGEGHPRHAPARSSPR